MKLLLMAASLRNASLNKKLIELSARLLADKYPELSLDVAAFADFDMPLYDGDLNEKIGIPEGAKKFIARLNAADGIIIASPEYNFSIPGILKNLIDWISRDPSKPLIGRKVLLMSASPSMVGGNRGLWQTRVPLEGCGAFVFPDMFSLPSAHAAFDDQGSLQDQVSQQRLTENLASFVKFVAQLKS